MRIIYLILILFTYNAFSSDDVEINADDIWVLDVRSNKFFRNGEVLFQMPQDALHTFRGREYGDWNEFSFIDSRLSLINNSETTRLNPNSYDEI